MEFILDSQEGKILLFIAICAVIFVIGNLLVNGKPQGRSERDPINPTQNNEPVWTRETKKKWTPSGWYYDERKEKWVSPDYKNGRANTNVPIIHENRQKPTYEEWKATREQE